MKKLSIIIAVVALLALSSCSLTSTVYSTIAQTTVTDPMFTTTITGASGQTITKTISQTETTTQTLTLPAVTQTQTQTQTITLPAVTQTATVTLPPVTVTAPLVTITITPPNLYTSVHLLISYYTTASTYGLIYVMSVTNSANVPFTANVKLTFTPGQVSSPGDLTKMPTTLQVLQDGIVTSSTAWIPQIVAGAYASYTTLFPVTIPAGVNQQVYIGVQYTGTLGADPASNAQLFVPSAVVV